jgi:hypothetical protein
MRYRRYKKGLDSKSTYKKNNSNLYEVERLNFVLLPNGSLTCSNVLSKNRPSHSQTRSRANKHGGENKDL